MPLPLTPSQFSLITTATNLISTIPRLTSTRELTDHTVSSACLTSHGRIFTGINCFHFSGSVCAENVAFANAAAAGCSSLNTPGFSTLGENKGKEKLVCVVAVANDDRGVISPCGRCRQFMFDYYPEVRVIVRMANGKGEGGDEEGPVTVGVDELLPFAYVSGTRLRAKIIVSDE